MRLLRLQCLTLVLPPGQNFGREWHQGGRQNHGPATNHGRKVTDVADVLDLYLL